MMKQRAAAAAAAAGAPAEDGALDDSTLASAIGNGEDLGTIIRAAFEIGRPEALLGQLRSFVKRKEVEIEELCRVHYEEFIRAVDELRNVLVDAEVLKAQLWEENGDMQEVGRALLGKLEELIDWHGVRSNLGAALASLKACTACVLLYARVNAKLDADELYAALKALDTVERDYMAQLPAASLCGALEAHMPLVRSYIEKKVLHEFTDWLVDIRGVAKQVGQHAMAKAAAARQREGELRARQRQAEEQSRSCAASGDSGVQDEVQGMYVLLDMEEEQGGEEQDKVELTAVYRAHYIHACLGLRAQFRSYYVDNRRLQLMSDLHLPPSSFLESHQGYLSQLAGFFIVEDHVLRTSGGLVDAAQVESLWESALTRVCGVLEEQLSRMAAANHMLLVKDNASLLVATLRAYGYACGPLVDTLTRARNRYHELLLADCGRQVAEVLANDKFEQMLLRKEYEYGMNVVAFQLQPSETTPAFPFVAPFSASVPACCRIVRDFASDSASFLSLGGGSGGARDADAVAGYVDKVVVGVVNEAMAKLVRSPTLGMSQAMQLAANLTVLEQRACDFWAAHVARLCGIPPRLAASLTASRTALRQTQAAAQERMLELVKSKIDDFMLLTAHIDWTPDQPPLHGNAYLNEVVIYLETLAPSAEAILPPHAFDRWIRGLLAHISDCIFASLGADDVRKFNSNAIQGIDADLIVLESFAHEHSNNKSSTSSDLRACLAPARQLVNLLLSNQPELYLNPVIREKSYSTLDAAQLLIIAEKYRDLPDKLFRGVGGARPVSKKKSFDTLVKRLREFA